jgi:glucose/arabinose dehydrogenase
MRVVLTTGARKLVPVSIGDPVILVYRGGCGCSGLHMFAEYASKASLGSSSQMLAFEEVGEAGGIPVFMNDQLRNYLEHIRVHTLAIDADGSLLVLEVTSSS